MGVWNRTTAGLNEEGIECQAIMDFNLQPLWSHGRAQGRQWLCWIDPWERPLEVRQRRSGRYARSEALTWKLVSTIYSSHGCSFS
jgi:hypothetical protein